MQNKILLKISFAVAIMGIFLLLLISATQTPKLIKIKDINEKLINKKIKILGQIIKIKSFNNNFQILTITDKTGIVDATLNKKLDSEKIKNQTIIVTGRITQYKNNFQISLDKIEIIK